MSGEDERNEVIGDIPTNAKEGVGRSSTWSRGAGRHLVLSRGGRARGS